MRTSDHKTIQNLLGAYAVNAVDPDEAAEVEAHLEECARCAAEVTEHRETLALLAPTGSSLRPRPFQELGVDLSVPSIARLPQPRRSVPAWTLAVAAVLIFMMAAVATVQTRRVDNVSGELAQGSVQSAAEQALADPDARRVTLETETGAVYADVAILDDGRGYLVPRGLPELPADQAYQLWALKGPEKTSLIVAGPDPKALAFRTTPDIDGLALTQEVAGGAPQPTRNPVAVAFLQAT